MQQRHDAFGQTLKRLLTKQIQFKLNLEKLWRFKKKTKDLTFILNLEHIFI